MHFQKNENMQKTTMIATIGKIIWKLKLKKILKHIKMQKLNYSE